MPNWCENKLIALSTNQEQLKEINELFENAHTGVFEKLLPTPSELLQESIPSDDNEKAEKFKEKYGAPDWYWWRVNNWGTKWDINETHSLSYHTEYDKTHGGVNIGAVITGFDTAWAPPEEIIRVISEKYNDVYIHLSYEEPGMGFAGCIAYLNGQVKAQEQVDMYADVDRVMDDAAFFFEIAQETENNV